MPNKYERYTTLKVADVVNSMNEEKQIIKVPGISQIGINSARLLTYTKGICCVVCGRKGSFFAVEKHKQPSSGWHLNLYHVTKNGHEILMTSDHIVAKAKGGSNLLENRQPMCVECNQAKGAYESFEDAVAFEGLKNKVEELEVLMDKLDTLRNTITYASLKLEERNTTKKWDKILIRAHSHKGPLLERLTQVISEKEKSTPLFLGFELDPMLIPRLMYTSLFG